MGDQMRVSPAELSAAAPTFADAGDAVQRALSALKGALPGAADMCGSDEAGLRFLAGYEPNLAAIEQAMQAVATGLPTVATGLRTAASNVSGADAASVMSSGG